MEIFGYKVYTKVVGGSRPLGIYYFALIGIQMQTTTKDHKTKSFSMQCISRKDECQVIYHFNNAVVYYFRCFVLIKDEFAKVYRFSTIYGYYCFTFPFLFLNKYRNLFFEHIKKAEFFVSMYVPLFTILK